MKRKIISILFSAIAIANALPYNCPSGSVPYKLSVLTDGSINFECSNPSCFGFDNHGQPVQWTKFYKAVQDPSSNQQSEFHLNTYVCGVKNADGSCPRGMVSYDDLLDSNSLNTQGVCCESQPVTYAEYYGTSTVKRSFEIAGGNIAPDVFAYISDVVMEEENGDARYKVYLRRLPCPRYAESSGAIPALASQPSASSFRRTPIHNYYPLSQQSFGLPALSNPACLFSAYRRYKRQSCGGGGGGLFCFTGDMTVQTADGEKRMDELQIGDYVLVGNQEYSRVRSWIHKVADVTAEFLKLSLNDKTLKISEKHLIYKTSCENNDNGERKLVFANELEVDDCVLVMSEDSVSKERIHSIEIIKETGIYAPETDHGDIVVNNVLASCYSNMNQVTLHRTIFKALDLINKASSMVFNTERDQVELSSAVPFVMDMASYVVPLTNFQK